MKKKIVKITGLIFIICIIALGLTILIGGRDAAEPDLSEFHLQEKNVADENNAYQKIVSVAESIELAKDGKIILDYIEGQPVGDQMAANFLNANLPAFEKLDKALTFKYCQAPSDTLKPEYVQKYYQVAILLATKCVSDIKAGRLGAGTKSAISLMRLGNMIYPVSQNLTDYNAGTEILQLGLKQARIIALSENVSAKELNRLAQALTTIHSFDKGLVRAIKQKLKSVVTRIESFRSKKLTLEESFNDTFFLPFFLRKTRWYPGYLFKENETKQTISDLYRIMLKNAANTYATMDVFSLEDFLGLKASMSRFEFMYSPNLVGKIFYAFTTPEFYTFLESKCQSQGATGATALLVAIKSYQKKNGKLPDDLTQLTPEYIAQLPLDPYNGQPFKYLPEKKIIYSVGKDLKDSQGSMKIPEGEIYGEDYPKLWIAEDAVFSLAQL